MRKLLLVSALVAVSLSSPVRAQFCPGAAPWVFDDVPIGDQFCGFITWAAQNGITLGCAIIDANHRLYCPSDPVRRDQMAAFVNRLGNIRVEAVGTGPGLTGGPITGIGTINLAATNLLPTTACANNQIARWNGSAWVCSADANSGGTVTSVGSGTGLAGGPITVSGTLSIATGFQLPQGCANGQVAKSNGSNVWTCATDANSGGTVTSITAGNGLTGGTITTIGTIAVDPASTTLTGNFFKQGGNAFGATAVLGATDNNALDIRVNGSRVMRYEPNAISPNVIGGSPANNVTAGVRGATIGGGGVPSGDPDPNFPFDAPNRVTDSYGVVGGGYANVAGDDTGSVLSTPFATVGGGFNNRASGFGSTVGGGQANVASGVNSAVAGGDSNVAGANATVGGGFGNTASGSFATVGGGFFNVASGNSSWAGGSRAKTQSADAVPIVHDGAFVWSDDSSFDFRSEGAREFAARSTGGFRFVTEIDGSGTPTRIFKVAPTGGAGINMRPTDAVDATLVVHDASPTVVLRGNGSNTSSRLRFEEFALATGCIGGYLFHDGAVNFFEIGVNERSTPGPCTPADDTRSIQMHRTTGRVGILTTFTNANPPNNPLTVGTVGNTTTGNGAFVSGAGVWTNGSSRTFKEAFRPVDGAEVLERLVALPISEWSYRGEGQRHIGPVAEDFKAAFGLGGDERYIGTVDADGIALSAIQGLNAKVEAQAREIADQAREIAELRRAVEGLMARTSPEGKVAAR